MTSKGQQMNKELTDPVEMIGKQFRGSYLGCAFYGVVGAVLDKGQLGMVVVPANVDASQYGGGFDLGRVALGRAGAERDAAFERAAMHAEFNVNIWGHSSGREVMLVIASGIQRPAIGKSMA